MKSRLPFIAILTTSVLLTGCAGGNETTADPVSPSVTVIESPDATPSLTPLPTPSPTPTPVALTGTQLREALLTPTDLGEGWRVTKRSRKVLSQKDFKDYSPECIDLLTAIIGAPIAKDSKDSAYVELTKGKDFGARIVSVSIEPRRDGDFDADRAKFLALIEECPSASIPGDGEDSLSALFRFTPNDVQGFEDNSFGVLWTADAIIVQVYIYESWTYIDGYVVKVESSWTQKSKKTFAKVMSQAVEKILDSSTSVATPSSSASISQSLG